MEFLRRALRGLLGVPRQPQYEVGDRVTKPGEYGTGTVTYVFPLDGWVLVSWPYSHYVREDPRTLVLADLGS